MPKKTSSNLAKRVRQLEHKQAADDKNVEYKATYISYQQFINSTQTPVSNMGPRTLQGTGGEGQGITPGNIRIGNEINLRHYVVTGYVTLPTNSDGQLIGGSQSNVNCRIIFADNLTNTDQLTLADVVQEAAPTRNALHSPYKNKVATGKRYKILADYKFNLSPTHATQRFKFSMKIPKSGRVLHYDGAVNDDPSDLNVSCIAFCDVSPLSANQPDMLWNVKTRFTDC